MKEISGKRERPGFLQQSRSGKIPGNLISRYNWINRQPLRIHLAKIKQYAVDIRAGDSTVVAPLLELIVALDFDPEIVEAAEDVLKQVTPYHYESWPFKPLGFYRHQTMPYYLGALFELLPEKTAVAIFEEEFLRSEISAGSRRNSYNTFLNFSTPAKAANFFHILKDRFPLKIKKLLSTIRNSKLVREYKCRRYDVADFLDAVEVSLLQARNYALDYLRLIIKYSGRGDLAEIEGKIKNNRELELLLIEFGREIGKWTKSGNEMTNQMSEWFNTENGKRFIDKFGELFGIDFATFSDRL